jgi:hypothetical protein
MSEQAPATTAKEDSIGQANKAIYDQYKEGVDRAEKRKAWLEDKSYKGVVRRGINTTVKTLLVQSPNMETYDDLAAPRFALEDSKKHFKEHEEAVKLEAVHDATAAGVNLNLPESDRPETAHTVQPIPAQEQKNN